MVAQPSTNRTQRRHPEQQKEEIALRIFTGGQGKEVVLGNTSEIYHLAKLTSAGTTEVQEFLTSSGTPSVDGDTVGEAVVAGCLFVKRHDILYKLLSMIIEEDLPENITYNSSPTDMMYAVDVFFEVSGLNWLARLVKDSASRASRVIEERLGEIVEQGANQAMTPQITGLENNPQSST
jgi:hypothetical protein